MTTEIKGTFYMTPTTYTIEAGDLNRLLKAELMLQALMETGVADWCGFPDAVEEYTRLEKEME